MEIVEDGYRDGNRVYGPTVRFVPVDEDDTDIGLETEEEKIIRKMTRKILKRTGKDRI